MDIRPGRFLAAAALATFGEAEGARVSEAEELLQGLSQPGETVFFTAHLLAKNEVPPVTNAESGASGDVNVTLQITRDAANTITGATARFDVSLTGFMANSSVILAQLHQGGATVNGPVRVDSGISPAAPFSLAPTGAGSFSRAGLAVSAVTATALLSNPADYYFNVKTLLNPNGAVRGQLRATCLPSATILCLNDSRFRVEVSWNVPPQGISGPGFAVPQTTDTGQFYFFTANNIELVIKVVDGRAFNGLFWVFYGALSNVEYTITVTDTQTGKVKTYFNPFGNLASVADTAAF